MKTPPLFRITIIVMASIFMAFSLPSKAHAGDDPVYTPWNNNVAVGGYDAVSFFSGEPKKGEVEFTHEYIGASWRFSTMQNLELFAAEPTKYAPQYGGYCAWAAGMGKLAKGSPKHWSVVDGKLYLNYNANIKSKWENDMPALINQANINWPAILD